MEGFAKGTLRPKDYKILRYRRNSSTQILMSMEDKSEEMRKVFNVVVANVINSSLSIKEINETLYEVNEFINRKALEQKIPTKSED